MAVDNELAIARVRIDTGAARHPARAKGDVLTGFRDRQPIEIPWDRTCTWTTSRPSSTRHDERLVTGTTEIDVVYLEPVTLEPFGCASGTNSTATKRSRPRSGSVRRDAVD